MNRIDFLTGSEPRPPRPAWSVDKFDDAGRVRRTPGLTTLCHVDRGSDAFAALVAMQDHLKAGPHAGAFAFLPPESFHMTVFDGVIDYRRGPGEWPEHMPADAAVDAVEADWRARLDGLTLPKRFAIRATELMCGFSVSVTGASRTDEAAIRAARDALSEKLGLRRANHETYRLHITLAYQIAWLDAAAAEEVLDRSGASFARAADRLARIEIGPVEFCRFETMHRFDPIRKI
jgi:hypothetical protein